jgi:hypothetical protein
MGHWARMIPDRVITTIGAEAEARIGRVSLFFGTGSSEELNARVTITELKFAMLGLRAWPGTGVQPADAPRNPRQAVMGPLAGLSLATTPSLRNRASAGVPSASSSLNAKAIRFSLRCRLGPNGTASVSRSLLS